MNQCDGCRTKLPLIGKTHYAGKHPICVCTKDRYVDADDLLTEFKESADEMDCILGINKVETQRKNK